MKKRLLFVLVLSVFIIGNANAQEKGQLFRFDEDIFEKVVKDKMKDTDLPSLVVAWTKDVLRTYCNEKKVKVDYTDEDYQRALDSLDYYTKQYQQASLAKQEKEEELASLTDAKAQLENEYITLKAENKAKIDELEARLGSFASVDADIANKRDSLRMLNDSISKYRKDAVYWKNTSTFLSETMNSLVADTTRMGGERREAREENVALNDRLAAKDLENAALSAEIARLEAEKESLAATNQKFTQAFSSTEETINSVYNENDSKDIIDMDASQLNVAMGAFEGMRPLLAIDADKFMVLEGRVNEMKEWSSLMGPLNEAREYLRGKFDDKQRNALIKKIKAIVVKDGKSNDAKNDMLTLLGNEPRLKENFDNIVFNLKEMKCLPDGKALGKALTMLNEMKGYVAKYYREGVYSSYDEAIGTIENELTKSEPSDDVLTVGDFKKFIERLNNMF